MIGRQELLALCWPYVPHSLLANVYLHKEVEGVCIKRLESYRNAARPSCLHICQGKDDQKTCALRTFAMICCRPSTPRYCTYAALRAVRLARCSFPRPGSPLLGLPAASKLAAGTWPVLQSSPKYESACTLRGAWHRFQHISSQPSEAVLLTWEKRFSDSGGSSKGTFLAFA